VVSDKYLSYSKYNSNINVDIFVYINKKMKVKPDREEWWRG
jgi:hypothetical protein